MKQQLKSTYAKIFENYNKGINHPYQGNVNIYKTQNPSYLDYYDHFNLVTCMQKMNCHLKNIGFLTEF